MNPHNALIYPKRYRQICPVVCGVFIILLFYSCKRSENKNYERDIKNKSLLTVDVNNVKEIANIKDILDTIMFVPLETTNESIIAEIEKVMYLESKFYVFDRKSQTLKIFKNDGKYIGTVGRFGSGPGEYEELDDFAIDFNAKRVLLLDNGKRAIHIFNSEGHYVNSVTTHMYALYINTTGEEYIYDINRYESPLSYNYDLIKLNRSGTVTERNFPFSIKLNYRMTNSGFLVKNDDGLLFNSAYNDTAFQITDSTVYPKYIFSFGSNKIPPNVQNPIQNYMNESLSYSYLGNHIAESKKFVIFSFYKKTTKGCAFFRTDVAKKNTATENPQIIIPHSLYFPINNILGITNQN